MEAHTHQHRHGAVRWKAIEALRSRVYYAYIANLVFNGIGESPAAAIVGSRQSWLVLIQLPSLRRYCQVEVRCLSFRSSCRSFALNLYEFCQRPLSTNVEAYRTSQNCTRLDSDKVFCIYSLGLALEQCTPQTLSPLRMSWLTYLPRRRSAELKIDKGVHSTRARSRAREDIRLG